MLFCIFLRSLAEISNPLVAVIAVSKSGDELDGKSKRQDYINTITTLNSKLGYHVYYSRESQRP